MDKKQFTYLDSKSVEHTISFEKNDFTFTQKDKKLFDQKIQTKPTTFFKDAMKRFAKNKSSVVGAVILGAIVLGAIILPMALPYDIENEHVYEEKLPPKLFNSGTGFWDGCKTYKNVTMNIDWDHYDETGELKGFPDGFREDSILKGQDGITYNDVEYIDAVNSFGHGGYFRLNIQATENVTAELTSWDGMDFNFANNNNYEIIIKTVDPAAFGNDWVYGDLTPTYKAEFVFDNTSGKERRYLLGEEIPAVGEQTFVISQTKLGVGTLLSKSRKPHLSISINSSVNSTQNLLIEKIEFTSKDENEKDALKEYSILNANKVLSTPGKTEKGEDNPYHWTTYNGRQNLFHAKLVRGSFRYDHYNAVYGDRYSETDITVDILKDYAKRGWLTAEFSLVDNLKNKTKTERQKACDDFLASIVYTDAGKAHCPLHYDEEHPITGVVKSAGGIVALEIHGTITRWKLLYPERNSAPRYLFGTNEKGKDLVKMTFSGLRTSLLLGLIVATVNFSFGLVWGAISGYFGGWVDIVMERFTDILHGVPWIVLMTLAIVRFGSSFSVFVMALCLTGWIGTAGLTRTQFYRFKNREYILASRTLGARDFRLIFRHILPNAVGTIVTSSVFMITSVIYSESTLAYLRLGLMGMDSFGVILADNQQYISTLPHLILFPSAIMLFMMISFNLFGNGLRDAFNPSLKGED